MDLDEFLLGLCHVLNLHAKKTAQLLGGSVRWWTVSTAPLSRESPTSTTCLLPQEVTEVLPSTESSTSWLSGLFVFLF